MSTPDENKSEPLPDPPETLPTVMPADLLPDEQPLIGPMPQGVDRISPKAGGMIAYAASHSGPLPPASQFAKYDDVLPGAAERILAMAERNQAHRTKLDNRNAALQQRGQREMIIDLKAARSERHEGRWIAFGITLLLVALAFYMVYSGASTAAASMLSVLLIGLALAYITGTAARAKQAKPPTGTPGESDSLDDDAKSTS